MYQGKNKALKTIFIQGLQRLIHPGFDLESRYLLSSRLYCRLRSYTVSVPATELADYTAGQEFSLRNHLALKIFSCRNNSGMTFQTTSGSAGIFN
jgi:hypothetical protein